MTHGAGRPGRMPIFQGTLPSPLPADLDSVLRYLLALKRDRYFGKVTMSLNSGEVTKLEDQRVLLIGDL